MQSIIRDSCVTRRGDFICSLLIVNGNSDVFMHGFLAFSFPLFAYRHCFSFCNNLC